ncbi:DUF3262 family protein [Testudinibacter sp. P80/BLE/0925]|uniref:DUF3262 family protein n=1 Tax=Pasteurellaceae TaxID=712 RepID=UPI003D36A24E
MSTESITAYESIAGSVSASYVLFVGVFAAFFFIVIAWIFNSAYKGWGRNMLRNEDLGVIFVRAAVLLTIVLFVVL